MSTSEIDDCTFLYFAYGSNLSKARLHIRNPSAEFLSVAKLQDFRLIFGTLEDWISPIWNGGVASIEETPNHHLWGVIWKIHKRDLPNLDSQEAVALDIYRPMYVTVTTPSNQHYTCRTYQMPRVQVMSPSPQYKNVILKGATEAGLPVEYMEELRRIEDNGYDGTLEIQAHIDGL